MPSSLSHIAYGLWKASFSDFSINSQKFWELGVHKQDSPGSLFSVLCLVSRLDMCMPGGNEAIVYSFVPRHFSGMNMSERRVW